MRQLLFISILLSALFHFCLLYSFSDTRLFDMQAYDSQIQEVFQVSLPTQTVSLTQVRTLDESINTPEDTAPLRQIQERSEQKATLKDEAESKKPMLARPKLESRDIARPAVDFHKNQQEVNQKFRLDLNADEALSQKQQAANELLASEMIETPTRTNSAGPLAGGIASVVSGSELSATTVKSAFFAVAPQGTGTGMGSGGAGVSGGGSFFSRDVKIIKNPGPANKNALLYQQKAPEEVDVESVRVEKGKLELRGSLTEVLTANFEVYHEAKTNEDYVRLTLKPKAESQLQAIPKDMLFLIDVSGSIEYDQLKKIRTEIVNCLKNQNEGDRFNIVLFSVNQTQLFENFELINEQTLQQGRQFIQRIKGSKETDIYQALMHSVPFFNESQRVLHMIFISDGRPTEGVRDYKKIINDFTRQRLGNVAFFTYDLGASGKRFLLEYLSYENRGHSFLRDARNPSFQLPRYLESYNWPVLYNLVVDQVDGEGVEVYPRLLKHLYRGRPLEILARLPKPGSFGLHFTGMDGQGNQLDLYAAINTEVSGYSDDRNLRALWADYKIYEMISAAFREGMTPALNQEIEDHNHKYNTQIARELKKYLS